MAMGCEITHMFHFSSANIAIRLKFHNIVEQVLCRKPSLTKLVSMRYKVKNLQENLIEVETLSFSGKNKIIRNMLSEKADYFKQYIDIENPVKPKNFDAFHSFKNFKLSFKQNSSSNPQQKEKSNLPIYLTTAMGILGTIGLGFLAIKNLSNSAKNIEDYKKQIHNFMQTIISKKDATAGDKKNLQNIFLSLVSKKEEIS